MGSKTSFRRVITVLLGLMTGALACSAPISTDRTPPTPWIVYITATPGTDDAGETPAEVAAAEATQTAPSLGPFGPVYVPELATTTLEPAVDVSDLPTSAPTSAPTLFLESTSTPQALTTLTPTASATVEGAASPTANSTQPTQPTPTEAEAAAQALPDGTSIPYPAPNYSSGSTRFADDLGLVFIVNDQFSHNADRMQLATQTGVGWDRYAIYWSEIERTANQYNWSVYDGIVRDSIEGGMESNAILIGTPGIYYNAGAVPTGLYEPIYSDGTDYPGDGKTINTANPWAEFVYAAASRYKPGGTLGNQLGWSASTGVRYWEIWNEPDFSAFWGGTVGDYARMLEVAYTIIKGVDPGARVVTGGLVYWENTGWMIDLFSTFKNDPTPILAQYPFDIVALHAYSYPPNSFNVTQRLEGLMAIHGISDKPIWINESGVAVWNDYPGPEWATRADQIVLRATLEEQAAYVIQNAAYAYLAETDLLFHFQLYDDCGNQGYGADFAPHNGAYCDTGNVCWGDALGLIRNYSDNVCFTQHPQPNTSRPAYYALRTVSDVFGSLPVEPFAADRIDNTVMHLQFARPTTSEVVHVLWNDTGSARQVSLTARSDQAVLIGMDGSSTMLTADENGQYVLMLNPATNTNHITGNDYMIGGDPLILIEYAPQPEVRIAPLVDNSRQALVVKWRTTSNVIQVYEVWYRDDTSGGGEWIRWFETDRTGDAVFIGGAGRTYSFFVRGQLPDGSWTDVDAYPQAQTRLDG